MEQIFSAKTRALLASAAILLGMSTPSLANSIPLPSPPVFSQPVLSQPDRFSPDLFRFGPASFGPGDILPNLTSDVSAFAAKPIAFGDEFFKPDNLGAVGLEAASLPRTMEISADFTGLLVRFLIVGAGVFAVVLLAVKSGRSMAPTKTPPAPVRTLMAGRSWAQPGSTFLPPRSVVEEIDFRPRSSPFPVTADTEASPAH